MAATAPLPESPPPSPLDPFRRAVLRGLGVLLPPLLTIVIFLWVGSTVARYVLTPLEDTVRYVLVEYAFGVRAAADFKTPPAEDGAAVSDDNQTLWRRAPDGLFVSDTVYSEVENSLKRKDPQPDSAREYLRRYVDERFLQPWIVVPIFLSVFLLLLYLLGKFLAAGIGNFFWNRTERLINRVPLVSNVYSSVKQVTDFLFTDGDLDISRVVAVEYPRKGIWTVAFCTGESLLDIESAANEPVLSVLIPTSPMPFTGFTITIKKSESVDLNLTIDQAFQFIVSCGVVVPAHQITRWVSNRAQTAEGGLSPKPVLEVRTSGSSAGSNGLPSGGISQHGHPASGTADDA
ncbi:DUF502 domain-containing protein [Botrimarina hoheduenensis]|uniref:DUF502 domain-containing protein n=1 Tax=Botrimarina hoheduenensis TaxID=2528000 RepID=A0A5C5VXQ2_9BACT|nr:DUF502 domain-containing protein [Botrimarina hoheduenensis]TWT42683.1 hypothetical protein Pla111_26560 [Botrimarina hoheduenensis]